MSQLRNLLKALNQHLTVDDLAAIADVTVVTHNGNVWVYLTDHASVCGQGSCYLDALWDLKDSVETHLELEAEIPPT